MKTLGIIGGTTWNSTVDYYKHINIKINQKLGDKHSAKIIINSLDYAPLYNFAVNGDWDSVASTLVEARQVLENAGCDLYLIGANTLHKVATKVNEGASLQFVNIIEEVSKRAKELGLKKLGLLGTKFTMMDNFYQQVMQEYAIEIIVPEKDEIETVNSIIFDELAIGKITTESKEVYLKIIENLEKRGADGIILGCTEIPMLIKSCDYNLPLLDTTEIHADSAVEMMLS